MKFIVKRALDTDVAIATVLDVAHGVVTRDGEVIATSFREDWFAPSFVVHAGASPTMARMSARGFSIFPRSELIATRWSSLPSCTCGTRRVSHPAHARCARRKR